MCTTDNENVGLSPMILLGNRPVRLTKPTINRRVSFDIQVASGLEGGQGAGVIAQQVLDYRNGDVNEEGSYFVTGEEATGNPDFPQTGPRDFAILPEGT